MHEEKVRPQKKAFEKAKQSNAWLNATLIIAFIFAVLVFALKYILSSQVELINNISLFGSVFFTIVIAVQSVWFSIQLNAAETERRAGLIDNAFGTKVALHLSKDYYDTNEIKNGSVKLLATIHENCMYTSRIAEKMLTKCGIKLGLMFIVLLSCFFIGISQIQVFEAILQFFLSGIFIYEFIDIYTLYSSTKYIEENSRDTWNTFTENRDSILFIAKATHIAIKYECAITRAALILDEKVYIKLNRTIEEEWKLFRQTYNI